MAGGVCVQSLPGGDICFRHAFANDALVHQNRPHLPCRPDKDSKELGSSTCGYSTDDASAYKEPHHSNRLLLGIAGKELEPSRSRIRFASLKHDSIPKIEEQSEKSADKQVSRLIDSAEHASLYCTVNKICEIPIKTKEVVVSVVKVFFTKITSNAVDDQTIMRHSETYADVMLLLHRITPTVDVVSDKPIVFTRVLVNVMQDAFKEMLMKFRQAASMQELAPEVANRLVALVSFIGQLYIRGLVAGRVMSQVVHDLIGIGDCQPHECLVRSACELILVIGKSFDADKRCSMLMTQFLARLSTLSASRRRETQESVYPQEIRDVIKAVNEARLQQWPARAGARVLVHVQVVSSDDASKTWYQLKHQKALSLDQMEWPAPRGIEGGTQYLKVSLASGTNLAILQPRNINAWTGMRIKDEISSLTGIHAQRLMAFKPDLNIWADTKHLND